MGIRYIKKILVSILSLFLACTIFMPVQAQNGSAVMYRLYNPNSGEHFYTADSNERSVLVKAGWKYEGTAWTAPAESSAPVYRLYNPNAGDHHYTTDAKEAAALVGYGWRNEGIGWYSDENKGQVLYRLYNPNAKSGAHHYTTSSSEKDALVKIGWKYEGLAWYGLKEESSGFTYEWKKEDSWDNSAKYAFSLTPESGKTITDWKVTLSAEGFTLSSSWNVNVEQNSGVWTLTPMDYNRTVTASDQVNVGMIIEGQGDVKVIDVQVTFSDGSKSSGTEKAEEIEIPETPVNAVGALHVSEGKLKNAYNQTVRLQGVSTHGLAWYPEYVSEASFKTLRDNWGINVVRLAMYTEEYGGYCSGGNQTELKNLIDKGVKAADALGMYVIIDWHILNDGNPTVHQSEACAFFEEMAEKYASYDNVIYEICNEPQNSPWSTVIKPYAEKVISSIRKYDSDAVILVGTNTWSQDIDEVIGNTINDDNVMYTLHFYASTHKDSLRNKLQKALDAGIPVFVSECSITEASGAGNIDYTSAEAWMNLMDKNNISFCAWSLCNKAEQSAWIQSNVTKTSGWTESDLTETGKWFVKKISD